MPGSSPRTHAQQGTTLTGQVTSIDRERGRLTLQTGSGTTQLPVPPGALKNLQPGQQVTVRIELGNGAPSASPADGWHQDRTDNQKK